MEGNILLQADSDIRVNDAIATSRSVELRAGRSININGDIDTSSDNNSIIIRGNSDEVDAVNSSEDAASINQKVG